MKASVVTGVVCASGLDLRVGGLIPIEVTRFYTSDSDQISSFGRGWTCSLDWFLEYSDGAWTYTGPDGEGRIAEEAAPDVDLWTASDAGTPFVVYDRTRVGIHAGSGQRRWFEDAAFEPDVLVVARLLRANGLNAGNEHELIARRELHDLSCGQERPRGLLARHHKMTEPRREPVSGIVLHSAQLGRDTQSVGHAARGA